MNNSGQQPQIGRSFIKDLRLLQLLCASVLAIGATSSPALAQPTKVGPRAQNYIFKTVDAPGKDPLSGVQFETWVNDSGLIIQAYSDTEGNVHTAALENDIWTVIDVPGAAETGATNPNFEGQVALTYCGTDFIDHLAIWQHGHYTYISDPCPGYVFSGAQGFNDLGQVTSFVLDFSGSGYTGLACVGNGHNNAVFTYPDAYWIFPEMTNDWGFTVGAYWDSDWVQHGFVYNIYDGTHLSIDILGGSNPWTQSINLEGAIVGTYTDSSGNSLGFELQQGHLTAFNMPGAVQTIPYMITDNHRIAGCYQAVDGSWHGFVATPVDG